MYLSVFSFTVKNTTNKTYLKIDKVTHKLKHTFFFKLVGPNISYDPVAAHNMHVTPLL